MRPLALLSWSPLLLIAFVGCTADNPAFDDCDRPEACLADDSEGTTELPGDGDPTTGDGDGEPETGDGDGEPETGDGDGEPETGDGDGDDPNALPSCPETTVLELPIVKDTFLVAAPEEGQVCIVQWDFETWTPQFGDAQMPCDDLDFGGAKYHWVCSGDGCTSMWLGRFDVGGWAEQAPKVSSAQIEISARIDNPEQSSISLHPLLIDPVMFGECNDWNPGPGWGHLPDSCHTTYKHSAVPNLWSLDSLLGNAVTLGAAPVPVGEFEEQPIVIPINTDAAQGWLSGQSLHLGVVMRSQTFAPTQFVLNAEESTNPPRLIVEVCSEL